ncbi:MBL fold metallo-hydrolase [bacterium]|nr:MBL fold metallo-hydrolase [bacterium]
MANLTFFGATGTVTGSRFLLEIEGQRVLIDCGLFQGLKENRLKNWDPFPVPAAEIDRVFLTHAHIDHTGYLPRLCREGFGGPVHCTHATADLCDIMLRDSAHIQEEDAYWANKKGYSKHKPALPLYTIADAEQAISQLSPLHYGEDFFLNDATRAKFKDVGHILGSALIDFKKSYGQESRKIIFSGDFGRPKKLILKEPTQVYDVDYLVIESTYGDRLHEEGDPINELARVINESVERGGVLLVPAFAVGRTQTLLYVIRELEETGRIPSLPVFVDSPMAINVTDIFNQRISDQNMLCRLKTLTGKNIYQPQQLKMTQTRDESKSINKINSRAIILSASGMATAGRILHHLENRLAHPKNTVLFIGYQAEGTRGRTLLEGAETVKIHGHEIPVKAKIEMISGYSGHADYNEILAWLMGFNKPPQKTFIVHGEPHAARSMAEKIREHFGWDVVTPSFGESFQLNF